MYYTCEEVAKLLRVKTPTVWGWIRRGKLKATRLNRKSYRIAKEDLETFLIKE